MAFKDKFMDFFTAHDDDYDDVYAESEKGYEDVSSSRDLNEREDLYADKSHSERADRKTGKVVTINNASQLQVVLVKPERFEDAPSIADHLNAKRTVVLNLESTPKDITRRLIDFLSGVAYANKGSIKRVAAATFMITPFNVDVMGDMLMEDIDNSALYR